jgi:glycyl-tRNA synthetase beta chain
MENEFIFEIGCEEIPASFLTFGMKKLEEIFTFFLNDNKINFKNLKSFGTPKRLGIVVENIADKQEDMIVEKTGPAKKAAFDEKGNPTKAAIGFAKSQGVNVNDLSLVTTDKGEYVAVKKIIKGKSTFDVLKDNLENIMKKLIFPKNMKWGEEKVSFARPIHYIVAVYKGKIVPFNYGSLKSGNTSLGHRFMSPEVFQVESFEKYEKELQQKFVIIDFNKRKDLLLSEVKKIAEKLGGKISNDEDLINTVTNLVEYPFPVAGKIEEEFLKLPEEVIITPMKVHQKYFPVYDEKNKLLPYFITVSNTRAKNMDVVANGNERVLKARLNDAKFFYDEDRKYKLEHFVERLRKVVFQKDIGTSYEKMERFKDLAVFISTIINPDVKNITERAAYLCKGDLETNMVYEFPELQGTMGKYYAIHSGENQDVANAIYEHYMPKFADDDIPSSDAGAFISIADRLDTIVGFFAIGKIPTGTADPYALRRHAISIIKIILGKKYRISLNEILNRAKELYSNKFKIDENTLDNIKDFISQRYYNLLSENFDYDVINSVLAVNFDDVYETYLRIVDVQNIKQDKDFQDVIVPFKRVANITKDWTETIIDENLIKEPQEKSLYENFLLVKDEFSKLKKEEKFTDALKSFTKMKDSINDFFDNVLVMDKNEHIKINRLNMLKNIFNTFNSIGDLTKIIN